MSHVGWYSSPSLTCCFIAVPVSQQTYPLTTTTIPALELHSIAYRIITTDQSSKSLAQDSLLPCNQGVPSSYPPQRNDYVTCPCITQRRDPASAAAPPQLTSNGDHPARYPVNATLCYFVCLGAPDTEAARSLSHAQLHRLLACEDAFFSVVQSSRAPNDMTPGTAFFPNSTPEPPVVKACPPMSGHRGPTTNTCCCGLGNGQSFPHGFSAQTAKDDPLVHWGFPNPEPVMDRYYNHPTEMVVREPDIVPANASYTYDANSLQGFPVDVVPPTFERQQL